MVWEDEQISSGLVAQETKPSKDAFSNSYFNQVKCKILNLSQCYCSHKHNKLDFTLFFKFIFFLPPLPKIIMGSFHHCTEISHGLRPKRLGFHATIVSTIKPNTWPKSILKLRAAGSKQSKEKHLKIYSYGKPALFRDHVRQQFRMTSDSLLM